MKYAKFVTVMYYASMMIDKYRNYRVSHVMSIPTYIKLNSKVGIESPIILLLPDLVDTNCDTSPLSCSGLKELKPMSTALATKSR